MGHLVNPISFRLGVTQSWQSQWYKLGNRSTYLRNLREDLTGYKYVDYFFNYFKILKKLDKKLLESQLQKAYYLRPSQIKKFKLKQYILVSFYKIISVIYSHVNITRFSNNFGFLVHLYDGSLVNFKPIGFFKSRFRRYKYRYKKMNTFIPIKKYRFRWSTRFNNMQNLHLLVTGINKDLKIDLLQNFIFNFVRSKYLKLNYFIHKRSFKKLIKHLKLCFCLLSLSKLKKLSILYIMRVIVFLLYVLNKKLIKYYRAFASFRTIFMSNLTRFKKKLKLPLRVNFLKKFKNLYIYIYNILNYFMLYIFSHNFVIKDCYFNKRFKYLLNISRMFNKDFNILKLQSYYNLYLKFFLLNNKNVTANLLCSFFVKRLSQKYHIFEILNPVIKELKKTKGILGFKIVCAGRLTKKQRAGLIVSRKRSVPLNTVNSIIDYSTGIVILRHGVSCIKVWLNKSKFFKVYNQAFIFKY